MGIPLDELPLRVRRVKIVGNNRTRPYVVEDQLQVGLSALSHPTSCCERLGTFTLAGKERCAQQSIGSRLLLLLWSSCDWDGLLLLAALDGERVAWMGRWLSVQSMVAIVATAATISVFPHVKHTED